MRSSTGKAEASAGQAAHRLLRLADRIDRALPQLQCGACGFAGCRPYAQALAAGPAAPDKCVPGGIATAHAIAELAGMQLDGLSLPANEPVQLAVIDEASCVGCIKCIEACPVDAIVGCFGQTHTVLADWCTGCGLCVEPCPTDCISLQPASAGSLPAQLRQEAESGKQERPLAAMLRARHEAKQARPSLRNPASAGASAAAELAAEAVKRARRHQARQKARAAAAGADPSPA